MKTTTYNTEKEIRIGIMIAVIISAVFTTFKVRELQLTNTYSTETMSMNPIGLTSSSFTSSPLADAKLIEEPAQAAETLETAGGAGSRDELAVQMKTWMNNKAYWSDEQTENEEDLTHYMTSCLKNGTFFSDEIFDESPATNEKGLTTKLISNLMSGSYFSNDSFDAPAENTTDLAGQMRLTLASGNFWNVDNK
jgi:hypothetical protein